MASETELFDESYLEQSLANLILEEEEYVCDYEYYECLKEYIYKLRLRLRLRRIRIRCQSQSRRRKIRRQREEYDYDCDCDYDYVEYDYGDEEEGKWLTYYSSEHKILLVGEGDFSFSLCLAQAFGSASNIYATSLDSYGELLMKYRCAWANLHSLEMLGAYVDHDVDVGSILSRDGLSQHRFDRIIFNFPHAGFEKSETHPLQIAKHKKLVDKKFSNASRMLLPDGEIHINHKTASPYSDWNINDLAGENDLRLTECIDFKIEDYPGYKNKKGSGPRCDDQFKLGDCSTFKFKLEGSLRKSEFHSYMMGF